MMSLTQRHRHLRKLSTVLPRISPEFSANHYRKIHRLIVGVDSPVNFLHPVCDGINATIPHRFTLAHRNSQVAEDSSPPEVEILPLVESTFDQVQGDDHLWLNRDEGKESCFKREGNFLVVACNFCERSEMAECDPINILENVKLLQQRFPELHVIGFHSCSSCSADQARLLQFIVEEFVTFPILLSSKDLPNAKKFASYTLFKDLKNKKAYFERDVDFNTLLQAVEEMHIKNDGNKAVDCLKSSWSKQIEVVKEPISWCSMQNLLLYFPGCICADEASSRLFVSDINHHRIVIFDGNGKIMDFIGSLPGFEDGEFGSAKLFRPAASFYHADEQCLYIVDSENHAIRRADLERRVLETVYPISSINQRSIGLWPWIMEKLGFRNDDQVIARDPDSPSVLFPWHLIKYEDNKFVVISKSFDTSWIMDLSSGQIGEVIKGFWNIFEKYRHAIMEKVSLLEQMPGGFLEQQSGPNCPSQQLLYAGLISSISTFQDQIVMCDMVGQGILRLRRDSRAFSHVQFSNFGILGLPYWFIHPLENFYAAASGLSAGQVDHCQSFNLLPGKVEIKLHVDIPQDTELAETLHESCIWRQARGAATEVLGIEGDLGSTEKVGVSQQWYDELDNLAFSTTESEALVEEDMYSSEIKEQDGRIHLDCAVNTSPGRSEVIVYAALYLKLRRKPDIAKENQERFAERIVDFINRERSSRQERDSCVRLLLNSKRDLRDVIFMKPLHVRINFNCGDHPKADNTKGIILTDSYIDVDVTLN